MQFVELLNRKEVEHIHEASLEILEDIGVLVNNDKAREIWEK